MTFIKISQLPSATALTGAEQVPLVQGGVTSYGLASQIGAYVRGLFTTTPAMISEGGTGAATAAAALTSLGGIGTSNIHAASSKATPVGADELPLLDSASSFSLAKLTWANLQATLTTYFNTLYAPAGSSTVVSPVRQTVLSGATSSGLPSALSIGTGLAVNLAAKRRIGSDRGAECRRYRRSDVAGIEPVLHLPRHCFCVGFYPRASTVRDAL